MDDELSRIFAFSQSLEDATATTLVRFRFGVAVFNGEFPHSWMHNFLRVDGRRPTASAAPLAQEADRLHGEARHAHRAIVVDDEVTGARLRPGLEERGYKTERNVVMVHRRSPDRVVDTSIVEEVDFERPYNAGVGGSNPSPPTLRIGWSRPVSLCSGGEIRVGSGPLHL